MVNSPPLEMIREFPPRQFQAAILDFDGTLSLMRRNWQAVMVPMMTGILAETDGGESPMQLEALVTEFVTRLTGKQTIYQMIQLAEEVDKRGGAALDPLEYKQQYHQRLMREVEVRMENLASGRLDVEQLRVPGSRALLEALASQGVELYLASGTDLTYVQEEVRLLELEHFFGKHIYGALDDYKSFSKAMIIERMIHQLGVDPERLLGFGDGYVEIEQVRKVGGITVGIASNEETREGIDRWKRDRLIEAGANIIIPDYRDLEGLLRSLGMPVGSS